MKKTYQEKIEYLSKALSKIQFALEKYKIKNDVSEYFYFAAEKKAEEVVQTAISINQDILASYYDFVSKSYYDSFIEIERLGIFSKNELEKLAGTTGFRNRLVHEYMELDRSIVLMSIKQILKLYSKYAQKIYKWLDEN